MTPFKIFTILMLACSFSICQASTQSDSAPRHTYFDPNMVQNAKPTPEPLSKTGNPKFYEVFGKRYHTLPSSEGFHYRGIASWYGTKFHGRKTSSGELYNMFAMTAANKILPIPCYAKVTNLDNGKTIIVKVNDRGPFHADRIIDLSYAAAMKLDMLEKGTANVEVETIAPHQAISNLATQEKQKVREFYLQLGAFGQHGNAKQLADNVREVVNESVEIFSSYTQKGGIHKVKVGPLNDELHAAAVNNLLKQSGLTSGVLTATPAT